MICVFEFFEISNPGARDPLGTQQQLLEQLGDFGDGLVRVVVGDDHVETVGKVRHNCAAVLVYMRVTLKI